MPLVPLNELGPNKRSVRTAEDEVDDARRALKGGVSGDVLILDVLPDVEGHVGERPHAKDADQ